MVIYAASKKKNAERVVVQVRYRATRATGGNPVVKDGGVVLQYRNLDLNERFMAARLKVGKFSCVQRPIDR